MAATETSETLGPVEMVALAFRQPTFDGRVLGELIDLVDREIIRVLDLMVIHKTQAGDVEVADEGAFLDIDTPEIYQRVIDGSS